MEAVKAAGELECSEEVEEVEEMEEVEEVS